MVQHILNSYKYFLCTYTFIWWERECYQYCFIYLVKLYQINFDLNRTSLYRIYSSLFKISSYSCLWGCWSTTVQTIFDVSSVIRLGLCFLVTLSLNYFMICRSGLNQRGQVLCKFNRRIKMKNEKIKQTLEGFDLISLRVTYFVCVNDAVRGSWVMLF